MLQLLARLLLLLAAVVVVEGHLMIEQSVAWLRIKDRTPSHGLQESIETTFSGKNPCEICYLLQIERSRHREHTSIPEATTMAKMIPLRVSAASLLFPPARFPHTLPLSTSVKSQWQGDIPHPPPWVV